MGLFSAFKSKPSKEQIMQKSVREQMTPELAEIAYATYSDNGALHTAAQRMTDAQVQECYQSGFLLIMVLKSYSEQSHQIMGLAAMGGHANACALMAFLQPVIEEVWESFADQSEFQKAKTALEKHVGKF